MRTLHIVLPSRAAFDLTPQHLFLTAAAITAACLMTFYVQLLDESVARGNYLRAHPQVTAAPHRAPVVATGDEADSAESAQR